jgi:plasmid stability protein
MENSKVFEDMIVRNISKEMKQKMRVIKLKKGISYSQQVRSALLLYFKMVENEQKK